MAGGAAAATTGTGLMKLFGGSREACLLDFGGSRAIDIYVLCHEVRGMDLSPGELVTVSLRDLTRSEAEKETVPGRPWELKQVRSDAVLQLRAWATSQTEGSRRPLGELRIQMGQLRTLGLNMLYQNWITLDPEGSESARFEGGTSELEQKMRDGSRQLFQPKICLSLCKAEEVTDGKMTYGFDISNDLKDERWSVLLRSQMQHVNMSHGLHQQHLKAQRNGSRSENGYASAGQIQDAIRMVERQAQRIQELKMQLRSRPGGNGVYGDALQRAQVAQAETQKLRESNQALKAEVAAAKDNLDKTAVNANGKIDAANERIRSLRKEREDLLMEADQLRAVGEGLLRQQEDCRREKDMLAARKEKLLEIIENVYQSAQNAGMTTVGRHSLKDISDITATYR